MFFLEKQAKMQIKVSKNALKSNSLHKKAKEKLQKNQLEFFFSSFSFLYSIGVLPLIFLKHFDIYFTSEKPNCAAM